MNYFYTIYTPIDAQTQPVRKYYGFTLKSTVGDG